MLITEDPSCSQQHGLENVQYRVLRRLITCAGAQTPACIGPVRIQPPVALTQWHQWAWPFALCKFPGSHRMSSHASGSGYRMGDHAFSSSLEQHAGRDLADYVKKGLERCGAGRSAACACTDVPGRRIHCEDSVMHKYVL